MKIKTVAEYVFYQIIFWIIAYIVLTVLVMLLLKSWQQSLQINILANFLSATVLGGFQGFTFGVFEQLLEINFFRKRSLILNIVARSILYFLTTIVILNSFRYILYAGKFDVIDSNHFSFNQKSWEYIFYLILAYNLAMSLVVSFVSQVNKKFGPGMMWPLILGKYQKPKEEWRAFLFIDLQSSTEIAETLGHIRYSTFIRDCFLDLNLVIARNDGEIYQYVGDEVVISWRGDVAIRNSNCIRCYFECSERLKLRSSYYQNKYGLLPVFKAGAHIGDVTAVEIGEIKREIAYHGDTLNTAARIQALCNQHNELFLISGVLAKRLFASVFCFTSLGIANLKGRSEAIEIFSVNRKGS